MKKYIFVAVAVLGFWLLAPECVSADGPTYTLTVSSNISAELGCVWTEGMDITYLANCFDCVETTCIITNTQDAVGVGVYLEDAESYTFTTSVPVYQIYTDLFAGQYAVVWDGYTYQGVQTVTLTIEDGESGGMSADPYHLYAPLVMHAFNVTAPSDNAGGIDYSGDTTWWEWAQTIEEFFSPVLIGISEVRLDIAELNNGTCGTPWNAFTPPLDPTTPMEFYVLNGTPTIQQIAYVMGYSLGRPMAYLRAFRESGNILGLNFFVMLIYFMAAGLSWIIFVTVVTYSARLIRAAVAGIIELYKLIPFKAT